MANPKPVKVRAIVTEKLTVGGFLKNIGVGQTLDNISNLFLGTALQLELISNQLHDPRSGTLGSSEKHPLKADAHARARTAALLSEARDLQEMKYEANFEVPHDFGEIGAVLVLNVHREEMFLRSIVLDGLPYGRVSIDCDSWIHSKFEKPEKRIFFTNKSYLPFQTPSGLKLMRKHELELLRGNGQGERKSYDRIYDYDTYNDLGNPDSDIELLRPVLGGSKHPYPRRCRTGRPMTKADPLSESKASGSIYVPRDEQFADIKELSFGVNILSAVLSALIPSLEAAIVDKNLGFPDFTAINDLFNQGIDLPRFDNEKEMKTCLPNLFKDATDAGKDVLCFKTTDMFERDELGWFRDEEFARQTLAGLNPYGIQLVTEWPLKSELDPKMYGPPESAITDELIQPYIGTATVEEAIAQKKLYMLDYHDLLLPFVGKVRQIQGTTLYGSRAVFYLSSQGTLVPVVIELTRPPLDNKPQWKRVYTRASLNSTDSWLWRLAKAHVLAHDSAFHQLISHWLRTHCCTEPYIIAANRQLSALHPIYRLLYPHFRYTMEINALARQALINADGIIETSFSARKYAMEFSSVIYDKKWRFDLQGLPADLISRGMAEEDPSAPHGLKLAIEDYPFANDGIILWDAIKEWVTEYVHHYYPQSDPNPIQSDDELQAWWAEIRNVGHGDKKHEPWWPKLETRQDLIGIVTTMIWVSSGQHAAVNFGQYTYAGYFPNRPTIARNRMPDEDASEEEWRRFIEGPDKALLESFPTQIQATKVMAVLEVLSTHSPDEEYIGEMMEASWEEDEVVREAFGRFQGKLKELEKVIDERNGKETLRNRFGAGVLPYELFKPFSKAGVTGMGVPNSISI